MQSNWIIYFEDHSEIKDKIFNGIILICKKKKKMATDHELWGNWELKTDVVYAKYENYDASSKGIKKKPIKFAFW